MYDFPSDATGKATPYGLYDQVANHAYVVVGMSAVTAAFAVAGIRRWWATYGRERYPDAHHIMIECDGAGAMGTARDSGSTSFSNSPMTRASPSRCAIIPVERRSGIPSSIGSSARSAATGLATHCGPCDGFSGLCVDRHGNRSHRRCRRGPTNLRKGDQD